MASVTILGFALSPANAAGNQVLIVDSSGNTRGMTELEAGESANVEISLAENPTDLKPEELAKLVNESSQDTLSLANNSTSNTLVFENVQPGQYSLQLADPRLVIAEVKVIPASAMGAAVAAAQVTTMQSVFVGGLGVVGGLGIAGTTEEVNDPGTVPPSIEPPVPSGS